MKNQASNIKALLKSSLSYLTIVVPTGVVLTGGVCHKNKNLLKKYNNQADHSDPSHAKPKAEVTPSVSDHTRQTEQACKEAEEYLNQSKQALAGARASTTQSALEKFKQTIQDKAQKADQVAKKVAQVAVDSKAHDAQQAGEYAQAARIATDAALENTEKVKAIQLRYYYSTHYPEKPKQAIQGTPKPITNRITGNPQDRVQNLNTKLNNMRKAIVDEITVEFTPEVKKHQHQ